MDSNKIIDSLIELERIIKKLYKKLYDLSIQNKTDTEEYYQTLNNILMTKELVNKYIKNNIKNYDEYDIISQEIENIITSNTICNGDLIKNVLFDENNIYKRLLNEVNYYSIIHDFEQLYIFEMEEEIDEDEYEEYIDAIKASLSYEKILYNTNNYIVSIFLKKLDNYIFNCNNKEINNILLQYKYNLIYGYSGDIEQAFLNNPTLYTINGYYENEVKNCIKSNEDKDIYEEYINEDLMFNIIDSESEFFNIKEEHINGNKEIAYIIVSSLYYYSCCEANIMDIYQKDFNKLKKRFIKDNNYNEKVKKIIKNTLVHDNKKKKNKKN